MSQAGFFLVGGTPPPAGYVLTLSGDTTPGTPASPVAGNIVIAGVGGIIASSAGNTVTLTLAISELTGSGTTVGATTADVITFPLGATPATYTIDSTVAAFEATTPAGAGYNTFSTFITDGATATLIGSVDQVVNESVALAAANGVWIASGNNAVLRVLGVVGLTINWTASATYDKAI